MCDCYGHPCEVCCRIWGIHLEDFDTNRDEVRVYCEQHMPDEPGDGVLYRWDAAPDWEDDGGAVYIQALTLNACLNAEGNHPNVAADWTHRQEYGRLVIETEEKKP